MHAEPVTGEPGEHEAGSPQGPLSVVFPGGGTPVIKCDNIGMPGPRQAPDLPPRGVSTLSSVAGWLCDPERVLRHL